MYRPLLVVALGLILGACTDSDSDSPATPDGSLADAGEDASLPDMRIPEMTPDMRVPDMTPDMRAIDMMPDPMPDMRPPDMMMDEGLPPELDEGLGDMAMASPLPTVSIEPQPDPPGAEWVGLSNLECDDWRRLAPAMGEEGHWSATRLMRAEGAFEITRAVYVLVNGEAGCSATVPHAAMVWTEGERPSAEQPARMVDVALEDIEPGSQAVFLNFDPPLQVAAGESIYVGVQMAVQGDALICMQTCAGGPAGASWWSNAVMPPFQWVDLLDFGISSDLAMAVRGRPVAD